MHKQVATKDFLNELTKLVGQKVRMHECFGGFSDVKRENELPR